MKRYVNAPLWLAVAALSTAAVLAEPAAAKNSVPFKGTLQAVESSFALVPPDVPFPTLVVAGIGSGNATHLGRFTAQYEFEVNLITFAGVGSSQFIAANGDRLLTEVEGQGTVPTADGVSYIVETHVITGGTGRFAGATGTFTLARVINIFTGVSSGTFNGTIRMK